MVLVGARAEHLGGSGRIRGDHPQDQWRAEWPGGSTATVEAGEGSVKRLVDLIPAPYRVITVGGLLVAIACGSATLVWQIQDWRYGR